MAYRFVGLLTSCAGRLPRSAFITFGDRGEMVSIHPVGEISPIRSADFRSILFIVQ